MSKLHRMNASMRIHTVLSTITSWTVVRENRSRNFRVLTWSWFRDVRMKTILTSVLVSQVWSFLLERPVLLALIDGHAFGLNRPWLYWPWFLFYRFLPCSRLAILPFLGFRFGKNDKRSSLQNKVLFVCFVFMYNGHHRAYNFLSVMDCMVPGL